MVREGMGPDYWREMEPEFPDVQAPRELRELARKEARLKGHVLFRTSGSGGEARWVALSKAALHWSAERVNEHLACGARDRWGCALPPEHVGGYGVLARASAAGGVALQMGGKWSALRFAGFCREERITVTSLVPAQVYDLVCEEQESPASLRVVVVGGGALSGELAGRARALGWPLLASYGMTETGSQIATQREGEDGGAGLPLIVPWEAEIDGESRIWVRGGGLFSCYVMQRECGWEIVEEIDARGWFRTGDVGRIAGGRLWVDGRAARMVKILGELVSLDRLDRIWEEVSAGAKGRAVLSVLADERRGVSVVLAAEEPESMAELDGWRKAFDERVAPFERIQRVLPVAAIPRGALGKVRQEELRRSLNQELG